MTSSRGVCIYVRTEYVCRYHVWEEGRFRDEIDGCTAAFFSDFLDGMYPQGEGRGGTDEVKSLSVDDLIWLLLRGDCLPASISGMILDEC